MDESQERQGINLAGYWLRIRAGRWWLLGFAFAGWVLATAAGWILPPKYRSETVILVEQQKVPEHYVEPNVASDLQHRLQSMSEQILSRTRLLTIINNFHLYGQSQSNADADGLVGTMRDNIKIELVRTSGRDNDLSAFKISYSANNPLVAQQVTGELTSLFINENLRNRTQLSEDTTAFLDNQLGEARKSLDQQEEKLRQFRSAYGGQLPDQAQSNVQILSGLQAQLQAATESWQRADQQRLFLQYQYRALGGASSKSGGGQPVTVLALNQKLEGLKNQLADLSTRYTPRHPDILKLQNDIAATEALRAKLIERAKTQPGTEAPEDSAAGATSQLTMLEGQVKANELDLRNEETKIKRLEGQIEDYRGRLSHAPVREQQLAALTRDYEQSRSYYDSLLAKKLQSEMATNLEKRQQGEQFRMIDPPNLPQKPYWPNRLAFSVAGLGLGAVAGLGLVLLFELANSRVYQASELEELAGIKVLASVPTLSTPAERRKAPRRLAIEGALAAVMLLVVSAGTLFAYFKG